MEVIDVDSEVAKVEVKDTNINVVDENENTINPWIVKHQFPFWWKCVVIFLGPPLLVSRTFVILISLIVSYILTIIALIGHNHEEPFSSWRNLLRKAGFMIFRCLIFCMGIIVNKKGKQVTVEEAPILVVAPHSTILDWVSIAVTRACPLAKYEISKLPIIGKMGRLLSTVWVKRDDQDEKNKTMETIKERCSQKGWPQLLIFPEGTTTNGQALVRFRTGAFSTGHSVQPLCIRRLSGCCLVDTITWTWVKDHSVLALLVFTLLTPLTFLELEFLPVITPTEDDISNPRDFANKVRSVFGDHLQLGLSDMSLKDGRIAQQEARIARETTRSSIRGVKVDENKKIQVLKKDLERVKSMTNYGSTSSIDFVGNLTLGI